MSKRFGFCEAGCKREVVAKEVYDKKVEEIIRIIQSQRDMHIEELQELENKLTMWTKLDTSNGLYYNDIKGKILRIVKEPSLEWSDMYVTFMYSTDTEPYLEKQFDIEAPLYRDFVDLEIINFETDWRTGGRLTYRIDGKDGELVIDVNNKNFWLETMFFTGDVYQYQFKVQ